MECAARVATWQSEGEHRWQQSLHLYRARHRLGFLELRLVEAGHLDTLENHLVLNAGSLELIPDFTGISAPYEAPSKPEIHIRTDEVDVKGAVAQIVEYLVKEGIISA